MRLIRIEIGLYYNKKVINESCIKGAESQLMLDPRYWGMQASMEDPRWQQFYQQQTKMYEQIEKYKHELLAQQQGRLSGYPLYPFYQKHFESQKKVSKSQLLDSVCVQELEY